jgi:8-oxo-dGTP pyrophosphatase MutT (NUDIX family)
MNFTTNQFGDIFPKWDSIPLEQLTSSLLILIEKFENQPKSALKITIPHTQASAIIHVKNAGFKLHFADDNKTDWILKKEAMVPEIMNAYGGVQVFVRRNNRILIMEEKFKQGLVTFVAGQVNSHEFPRNAAIRELEEEVELKVDSKDLKLFASRIRMKANKEGATNYDYFFVVDKFDESEIKPNPEEVLQLFWINLSELINTDIVVSPNGTILKTSPMIKLVAHHLYSGTNSKYYIIPDCRQWHKKIIDETDVLHLEFFKIE